MEEVMVYQWRETYHAPKDLSAEVAHAEVERLRELHNGSVKPEHVVEAARKRSNPLHPVFEWDDTEAAKAYRLTQARTMIGAIVINIATDEERKETVRAFVNVSVQTNEDQREMAYVGIENALETPEYRENLVANAYRELEHWRNKWKQYKDPGLLEAIQAVERLLEKAS
jgi:hypothetical protein